MVSKNKNLEEIKENIEADRDSKWLDQLSLYYPSIKIFSEQDGVTVENIVDYFYREIIKEIRSKDKPQSQIWGTVELDLP